MFSTAHAWSKQEWELVDSWLDRIYADFTGKVAAGRGLSAERVHELARGRVWTGADARERGLVDEIGGVEEAAAIARRRGPAWVAAPLVSYPASRPARPVPSGRQQRRPPSRRRCSRGHHPDEPGNRRRGQPVRRKLGSGLAGGGELGLPSAGPLLLPGSWTFQ